ncbi:poly(ADP-ribose) glycohydrolase [Palaemon carinicauda]|uniref:poly(ADP-ribose) glycohydrolase n=1 Tax=Palaemon carinicauda TaxID=392227 RepID=UPI0035B694A5
MSEVPPRKKLRQMSLVDMFKPGKKDLKVLENIRSEDDTQESNLDHSPTLTTDTNSASSVMFSGEEETFGESFAEKEKSPQKQIAKKHLIGKNKKKRRHMADPNLNTVPKGSAGVSKDAHRESSDVSPSKISWRGCPLSTLQVLSNCSRHVPTVHLASDHTVLVKLPIPDTGPPEPHPSSYSDIWDQHHVRMPCSPKSLYPIASGNEALAVRWSVICKALKREMKCVNDLQRTILEYNTRYAEKWNFKGLHELIDEEFEDEEREYFFQHTLPAIANLALDLPNIVTQPPPLLTRHSTHSVTLSQIQIASLLANAFFCTFPRRNAKGGDTEYASYPDINFNRLFSHKEKRSLEKLKCIINYFRRVTKKRPEGLVTFTRQYVSVSELPSWESSSHHLPDLHLDSCGLIEEKEGLLQVDFANKFIGGGVLGLGCVQEEIRFVLSPELIVSRLFTQILDKTEALIITGAEQYNQGSGYASTFCWTSNHQDSTKCDIWKRRLCQVVAIDALRFTRPKVQYRPPLILRELNKVYAGFRALKGSIGNPIGVATGNWGCGAFNGNARLKALIQLAACGFTGRNVAYFTFGDEKLRDDLSTMHIFLKENNVTVGELVQVLMHYGQRAWVDGSDLYHYIYHSLGAYNSDTDEENVDFTGSIRNADPRCTKPSLPKKNGSSHNLASSSTYGEPCKNSTSSLSLPQTMAQSSQVKKEENLTEEKIVQVLMECDRLVEGQKWKNPEKTLSDEGGIHDDNKFLSESSEGKSQSSTFSTDSTATKLEKNIDKASKSLSEPISLLGCLDDIDKKAGT